MRTVTTILALFCCICVSRGQFEEHIHQVLPPESRFFTVADLTKAIDPVFLLAGDGAVTAVPGGGFADVALRYGSKIFDGVAAIDTATAFAGTGDGTIIRLDLLSRREVRDGEFPTNGSSLVRCGTMAAAVRDGYIIRLRRVGDAIVTDTLIDARAPYHVLSACNGTMAVAIDTVRNKLTLVDLAAMRVEVQRAVPRNVSFLQSLSDSLSVVMTQDSVLRLALVWHYTDSVRTLGQYMIGYGSPVSARLTASVRGGGAIVRPSFATSQQQRQILFAVGSRPDSATWVYDWKLAGTETIQAGVAWWHRSDAMPIWHVATPYTLHTTVDTSGAAKAIAGSPFLRGYREIVSPLLLGGDRTLGVLVRRSQVAPTYSEEQEFFYSVDGGASWTLRPSQTVPVAIDETGTVLSTETSFARGDTTVVVHLGVAYSTTSQPILTLGSIVSGAHLIGDTILVFSTKQYRSTNRGVTWDSASPPSWEAGRVSYARGSTIVVGRGNNSQGPSGRNSITTDAGTTWRSLSFVTTARIITSVPLADTAVLGSWQAQTANAISESNGTITAIAQPGHLAAFAADNVYYGTALGMRPFDRITRRLGAVAFTAPAYADPGTCVYLYDSYGRAVAGIAGTVPVFNHNTSIWFLAGTRLKEIRRVAPTSVDGAETIASEAVVRPNPSSSTVEVPHGTVRIVDLTGSLMVMLAPEDDRIINVHTWPQGAYIVRIQNGARITSAILHVVR